MLKVTGHGQIDLKFPDPERGHGTGSRPPSPGKSQVAIGFLRNTGMDSHKKGSL